MKHLIRTSAAIGLAFAAGIAAGHVPQIARAATAPLQPAGFDLAAMSAADLPAPGAATPNLRSKTLVVADGATVAVQLGTVFKHMHQDANEIQVVLSGSGTEWLGDHQVALKPGMMIVIPAGTAHGGTTDSNLKVVSLKTPPQAATDIHPLP